MHRILVALAVALAFAVSGAAPASATSEQGAVFTCLDGSQYTAYATFGTTNLIYYFLSSYKASSDRVIVTSRWQRPNSGPGSYYLLVQCDVRGAGYGYLYSLTNLGVGRFQ